jgi:hypothetical protein
MHMTSLGYFNPSEIFLQYTACSWDVHFMETYTPLMNGCSIALIPATTQRDFDALTEVVDKLKVSTLISLPSIAIGWSDHLHESAGSFIIFSFHPLHFLSFAFLVPPPPPFKFSFDANAKQGGIE